MFSSQVEAVAWGLPWRAVFLAGGAEVAAVARNQPDDTPATLFIEADLLQAEGAQAVIDTVTER